MMVVLALNVIICDTDDVGAMLPLSFGDRAIENLTEKRETRGSVEFDLRNRAH